MDFDNPKFYGDTFISDGPVSLVVVSSDQRRLEKALYDQEMHKVVPQIIYNKKSTNNIT